MIEHYDYYNSLVDFLKSLKLKKGLDIGLGWGESTHAFLITGGEHCTTIDNQAIPNVAEWLAEEFPDKFTLLHGDSSTLVNEMKDKFDWIHIDGDHSYAGCLNDIRACLPRLAKGGVLAFDDYVTFPEVKKAVMKMKLKVQPIPNHPNGGVYVKT